MRFFLLLMMSVGMVLARETRTDAYTQAQFQTALKQAERGDVDAQIRVAFCYHDGSGVKEDRAESLKWMEKAANEGDPRGQTLAGLAYWLGIDAKVDIAKGRKLVMAAADQGDPGAYCWLSVAYFFGNGVGQDYVQSYKYGLLFTGSKSEIINKAERKQMKQVMASLDSMMKPEQIAEGKRLAKEAEVRLSKLSGYSIGP